MVRNGYGVKYIWYEIAILWYEMVNYGTKWLWCKIHMVRNGFWLWYEIAILWYEMVNYGTKWQWYEMVMVRNDLLRLQSVKFFFIRQYVQPCLSKNPKYTFYTIKSSLTLAY